MSCSMTKPTKWRVLSNPPSLISHCMMKPWVYSYPMSAQQRLWPDCTDAKADQSLCWAHSLFCWFCQAVAQILKKKEKCYVVQIYLCVIIWAASSKFGTYCLCEQRRFKRACASAQYRQNLCCSLIQAVSQEKARSLVPLNGWACAVKICHDGMLEDTDSLDVPHIMYLLNPFIISIIINKNTIHPGKFPWKNEIIAWRIKSGFPCILEFLKLPGI